MIEGNTGVRLSVDSSARALVIKSDLASSKINIFGTTTISASSTGQLIVGRRTFYSGSRTTVMDVQEFAKLLQQFSNADRSRQALSSQRTISSAVDRNLASARLHYRRAAGVAAFVERLAYVFMVLSIIGGLVIAFSPDPNCGRGCDFVEKYPNVWSGILIGLYGVLFMLAVAMLAAYVRGRAAESGA